MLKIIENYFLFKSHLYTHNLSWMYHRVYIFSHYLKDAEKFSSSQCFPCIYYFIIFCINHLKLDSKWEYCSPLLWMNGLVFFFYWLVKLLSHLSIKPTTLWFAKIRISMKIPNSGCSVRKLDLYFCQESCWLRSHSCRALCCVHTMHCGQSVMKSGKVYNNFFSFFLFHFSPPYLINLFIFVEDLIYFLSMYFFSISISQLYSFLNCAVGWHETQCHLKSKLVL